MLVYKCLNLVCRKFNCFSLFAMFYAVKTGRKPGVYTSWSECEEQVKAFPKPKYKKFPTEEEAWEFIKGEAPGFPASSSTELPQVARMSTSDSSVFCDSLNTVKLTAKTLQHQMEMMSSTFDTLCNQIEHLEKLVPGFSGRTFSASDSVGQFSNSDGGMSRKTHADAITCISTLEMLNSCGGMKRKLTPLKRSFTDGPYPVEPTSGSKVKKSKTCGEEENWTGRPFNEEQGTVVYTDGSCVCNGKNGARAGIGVYWGPENLNNVSERLTGRPTNNRAEIHAARKAIEQAQKMGIKNLMLYTDSMFLINSITKWVKGWKKNGWILTTGKPVINRDDFEQLEAAMKNMNIKWIYVRGHRGDPGNEAADKLATTGAKKPLPDD